MNLDPNAGSLDALVRCHPDWIGPWQDAQERKCPDCGCRVPQYDKELEASRLEVKAWQDVATQLYAAMGLSRRERRRIYAENAYRKLDRESQLANANSTA